MRRAFAVFGALLSAAPVLAQRVVAPAPSLAPLPAAPVLPVAPSLSPTLGSLESLSSLPSLEALPSLGSLQQAYDGVRPLTAAPDAPAKDPQVPPIPKARTVEFNGTKLPAYAFSHQTKPSKLLVQAIDATENELLLALHGFSIPTVADAILRAHERKVKIRLVCNEEHFFPRGGKARSPELQMLLDAGIEIKVLRGTGPYGTMHNKVAIFDGKLVKFGSFNWSDYADTVHYENVNFRTDPKIIAGYKDYYGWLWKNAKPVEGYRLGEEPVTQGPVPVDPDPDVMLNGEVFPKYQFSPKGGIEANVARAIDALQAGEDLRVGMFSLYSRPIAEALVRARDRGVKVRIVVDKMQGKRSPEVRYLLENNLDVRWAEGHGNSLVLSGVMHHKFGVFGDKMVEMGSFNWTGNGENHNFENANFSNHEQDVAAYTAMFELLWSVSEAFGVDQLGPEAFVTTWSWPYNE